MTLLTLDAFRATATRFDATEAMDKLGIDRDGGLHGDSTHVWIYDGDCYLEECATEFCAMIGRDDWSGSQDEVSAHLYFDWYVSEGGWDKPDLAALSGLLREWAAWRGLPLASADEMRAETEAGSDRFWLDWFLRAWDEAEEAA